MMSETAGEEQARRKADPREAMLDQLGLLVDEATALSPLLGSMPDELIHGRPLDTMPSVADLLMGIVIRDRTVRRQNLLSFLAEDEGETLILDGDVAGESRDLPIEQILRDLREERTRLVVLAEELPGGHWDRSPGAEGGRLTPFEYLSTVVQSDAATLRQIAERIFESRPAGSPGLSRH